MRRASTLSALVLALALPLLGGCAIFRHTGQMETVGLEVQNDLQIPTAITVYVVSSAGNRQLLGTVNPGTTTTLIYRSPNITGSYRFVAREASATRGGDLTSTSISLSGGETVSWRVRDNLLLLVR